MKEKHLRIMLVIALIGAVGVFTFASFWMNNNPDIEPNFGVTYSWLYAEQLGLDYKETYKALVHEMGVKSIRLPIYWSDIESAEGEYDWKKPDWLIDIAEDNDLKITMVVGAKVPRWPECFVPDWVEKLNTTYQQQATLSFIEETVNRYKNSSAIVRWQVENEPFFPFGECPKVDVPQITERVDLVRRLDDRPIQMTVSGELGSWIDSAEAADILGISMYRQTWNDLFGYFVYPLSPEYYYFRAKLVDGHVQQVIVSELQAEPWFNEPINTRSIADWYDAFTVEMFQENISFAREAGLSEVYLWGAEWWYALRQAGEDRLWNEAQSIFE
ncbi:MAG: beta-galactosidase [Parcubacteria group bacterium]|nr:beta-galactosidase [Parcubacteria group bacterium]